MRARFARIWRERRGAATGVIGAAAVAVLLFFFLDLDDEVEEIHPGYPQVETMVVGPVDFQEWIEMTGTIEARSDALLSAEVAGTVLSVAQEGVSVQPGEIVAQIDARQAEAAVQQARAAVAEAEAGVRQAQDEFQRQEPLLADTIISPLEFEQVRARLQQALAQRQQTLAMLRESEQMLEQTRLRAPFAGTVERRWVRAGEQVSPGQEVVRIVGPGLREVSAGIPERFAGEVLPGARAEVGLNAYGLGTIAATVDFVGNAVDPQSRTIPVRIGLDDPRGAIKADMIARVRVVRRVLPGALVVPRDVVVRDEREQSVLVVERSGREAVARHRPVTLGPSSPQGLVVQDGLSMGEHLLVTGQDQVIDGDTVRIVRVFEGIEEFRATLEQGAASP